MDVIPQTPYERLAPLRNDYNKRLRTFEHRWPSGVPVTPQALAQDGFYYTGLDDKVQCTHCGGILSGWCEGDVVTIEHRQHFPNCPWVRQGGMHNGYTPTSPLPSNMANLSGFSVSQQTPSGENFNFRYESSHGPTDVPGVTRPKFQNYTMEAARKASFTGWPTQITQRPEVLSKAGFFYLGEGDKCKCFYCGGILWDWEPGDDPWVEHAKWFPDCPWIKLAKGDQFIQQVQEEMNRMQIDDEVSHGPIAQETSVKEVDPSPSSVSDYAASGPSSSAAAGASKIPAAESAAAGTSKTEEPSDKEKKLKEILEENRNLKEQKLCKICLDEEVGVLFEPCGHICCCASCAAPLQQCPICRKPIQKSLKAFIS
ncbi:putative inhibitor of apoptosis [Saccostrea cucullata]|uniref:putative inhibitor of apoptosis n=1 Tax=Saccostrea cuccullata TaxID=36930 RepID=UPI002ED00C50